MTLRQILLAATATAAIAAQTGPAIAAPAGAVAPASLTGPAPQDSTPTATPIKHVVVLFNENVSFDHYFATYPKAANPPGEPAFTAASGTPAVNNLANANLLANNPNVTNTANGTDAAEPFRLDRTQANTADQNHAYTAEEQAYNNGKADLFPKYTGKATAGGVGAFGTKGQVMGYFDGNTVGAMWQYAQHFAMSDNAYTDTYGPSTPGALNLISGQTNGMQFVAASKNPSTLAAVTYYIGDGQGGLTMINDVDPGYDTCSVPSDQSMMKGQNVGDLLNTAKISWGGFMGGFNLDTRNANGTTGCKRSTHSMIVGADVVDYIAHHNWFQYFASTANPKHARPSSTEAIGYTFEHDGTTADPANHEYDLQDFYDSVKSGNFPAVSVIKLPAYQDGHAGYSDPLDEQNGTATLINFLQQQPGWKSTAVIIAWDDSDGWYHHAYAEPNSTSFDVEADQLNGPGKCGTGTPLPGVSGRPVNGRCGPGTRLPFLVISPWAKPNYVSHQRVSLASVTRFIEDNWLQGARLGGGSFDAAAGSIMDMFDTAGGGNNAPVYVDPAMGTQLSLGPGLALSMRGRWPLISAAVLAVLAGAAVLTLLLGPLPLRTWRTRPMASLRLTFGVNPYPVHLVRPPAAPLSAMAQLGRQVFFDASLSSSGQLACASCHVPARAYGPPDGSPVVLGGPTLAAPGVRSVPSLMYLERQPNFSIGPDDDENEFVSLIQLAAMAPQTRKARKIATDTAAAASNVVPQGGLFWDGRSDTLQDQALYPLLSPFEMDGGSVETVATKLQHAPYADRMVQLFGESVFAMPRMAVAEAMFAVARFQIEDPSFHPYSSKFDAWLEGKARLSQAELRGWLLYNDPLKANCGGCHLDQPRPDGLPPIFTDDQFEALGAPRNPALANNKDPNYFDLGICGPYRPDMQEQTQFCAMFITPTLRNVATRKVFFHNGVFHSLQAVQDFYNFRDVAPEKVYPRAADGTVAKYDDIPPRYRDNADVDDPPFDRNLGGKPAMTAQDELDIIAFLGTLTDGYTGAAQRP